MIKKYIYQNKVDANTGGGGAASDESKEQKDAQKDEAQGQSNVDEFGYEIKSAKADDDGKKDPNAGKEAGKDGEKKDESKVQEQAEEIKDSATGYGAEPPLEQEEEKKDPPAEKKESEIKLDYEVDAKGLDLSEVDRIKKFAKDHALPQAATQALLNARKSEIETLNKQTEEYKKKLEKEKKDIKSKWDKELRSDKEFGGENFAHNVHQVDKVLQDLMPEAKKELTERGLMLAPYFMKGLLRVAKSVYAKENFVQGDPAKDDSADDKPVDPLDFYR